LAEENDEALAKLPQAPIEFQKWRRFLRALVAGKPVWSFGRRADDLPAPYIRVRFHVGSGWITRTPAT